ncbi:MAG: CBS domain-containing protein [Hyphomicrobiaceae bacterium]
MEASDVMTSNVITVAPDTTVRQVARIMAEKHISGLPVVSSDGAVLGMVSESDLLRRSELGTESDVETSHSWLPEPEEAARRFAKSHGRRAHDIMSRPVVSVADDVELRDVAEVLERHKIKRVPVIKDGHIIGLIARSDLIRAFSKVPAAKGDVRLGSGIIHRAVTDALKEQSWLDTSYVNLTVKDGHVGVWGYIQTDAQRDALAILIEEIPGVESVENNAKVGVPTLNWDGSISSQ